METKPKDSVIWESKKIIRHEGKIDRYDYEIVIPDFLAAWDVWDYWEKERFNSMRRNLKKGDILFDIGTETGWVNIIYAKFVGGENLVLVEPTPRFWPNIKATWEKNNLPNPKYCFAGFFGAETTNNAILSSGWPIESEGDLITALEYKYIHQHTKIPQVKVDDFVYKTNIIPNALTMDIEGGELLVLRGAENTLKKYKPKVWVSIHPDLSIKNYGYTKKDILKFMRKLKYKAKHLATDHEEHWYFYATKN